MNIFDSKEYKRSRTAYAIQCTVEYLITLLITDAFLAKLLKSMDFSDSLIGIISSFISLAFLFQLLAIVLVKSAKKTKTIVIILNCTAQLLFMCLFLVPFITRDKSLRIVLSVAFILLGYAFVNIAVTVFYKWANSFVEPGNRATYSAKKEMFSLATGIVFSLSVGLIFDKFEASGNIGGAFVFIAASILILNVVNFISLLLIKKEAHITDESENEKISIKETVDYMFHNKNFITVIIMTVIFQAGRYITVGFIGTFKTVDLGISVGTVQIISIVACAVRFAVSLPIGILSDRTSFARVLRYGYALETLGFLSLLLIPNANSKLLSYGVIAFYSIAFGIGAAATNQNAYSICYNYVDAKYIAPAMAIKNSIAGVVGFLFAILGGKLLNLIQQNNNVFLGIKVFRGQQVLAAITAIIYLIGVLYVKFVIEKQKRKVQ